MRNNPVSGAIYNAGMGYFNRVAVVSGPGAVVGDGKQFPTPDAVAANMDKIRSLEGAEEFPNAMATFGPMLAAFSPKKEEAAAGPDHKLTVKGIFERLPDAFRADRAGGVDVVFQFDISGAKGGAWNVTIKEGACEVAEGSHNSPTSTIKMGDDDFVKMIKGELNAMSAFTAGKLKVEGDLMKSQLIEKLFKL